VCDGVENTVCDDVVCISFRFGGWGFLLNQSLQITLEPRVRDALIARLTAMADDELILAHRNSEWTGHAPILEEDIAIANIAQDELGHAGVWLELRHALDGSDPDRLVFWRDGVDFRNAPLLELPRGDWAFTMLRQFLFDAFEVVHLDALRDSTFTPLAEASLKVVREERFHLQHSRLWLERLGLGTQESHSRLQNALRAMWSFTPCLFAPTPDDAILVSGGIAPDLTALHTRWLEVVTKHLERAELEVPVAGSPEFSRAHHTPHLMVLLEDLQGVARADPEARAW
jgi:ring-1,2-phenylacetyl-CoA epoxidase subunit PaaC